MSELSIQAIATPLSKASRQQYSQLLADAFANDSAMRAMLGTQRWHQISKRYFDIQLPHSDVVLVASLNNQPVGIIAARTPGHQAPFLQTLSAPLQTRWLLGRHFRTSNQIGQALSAALPQTNYWYINHLGVALDHQHSGIGVALLRELTACYRQQQLITEDFAELFVDCETKLETFYGAQNFRSVGGSKAHGLVVMKYRQDNYQEKD